MTADLDDAELVARCPSFGRPAPPRPARAPRRGFFADRSRTDLASWRAAWNWRDMRRELDRLGSRRLTNQQWAIALRRAARGYRNARRSAHLVHRLKPGAA